MKNPMLDETMACIRRRWPVFPCKPGEKVPATANGVKNATLDAGTISNWWQRMPNANLGIATGEPSGVWVLDVDGPKGLADLAALENEFGSLPETYTVRTGGGGRHLYFKMAGHKIANKQGVRGLKLDVRGTGGYVVGPPSMNGKGPYTVEREAEVAEAPAWLIEFITTEPARPKTAVPKTAETPLVDRARKYLAKVNDSVEGEHGSNPMFWAARIVCWRYALDDESAFVLLCEYNARARPQWSEKEIRRKMKDAREKECKFPYGDLRDAEKNTNNGTPNSAPKADAKPAEPEPWEPPTPLPTRPPVPAFPIHLFPATVRNWWEARSERVNVSLDIIGTLGIAALGTAVGRAVAGEIVWGYSRSPLVWAAAVDLSGSGKTAGADTVFDSLRDWDLDRSAEFAAAKVAYDEKIKCYKAALNEWREAGSEGEPPEAPAAPVHSITMLENITSETLPGVLRDNPKGGGLLRDEFGSLLLSLNQYKGGSGSDRAEFLRLWSGEGSFSTTRGGAGERTHNVSPHCFLAMGGCLTPADAVQFATGTQDGKGARHDGYAERFLIAWPNPRKAIPLRRMPSIRDAEEAYESFVRKLLTLPPKQIVKMVGLTPRVYEKPHKITASAEAFDEWLIHDRRKCATMNSLDESDPFRGWVSKMSNNALALATLFYTLELAEEAQIAGGVIVVPPEGKIEARHVRAAWELVAYYFGHAQRVWGNSPLAEQLRRAGDILDKLRDHAKKQATWTRRDIHKLVDRAAWAKDRPPSELDKPVSLLAEYGYLREVEAPRGRGRPTERYELNPNILAPARKQGGEIPDDPPDWQKPLENDGFDGPNIAPRPPETEEYAGGEIPDADSLENKGETNGETPEMNFAPQNGPLEDIPRKRRFGPAGKTGAKGGGR